MIDVDVAPDAERVGIVVSFAPDGVSYGGWCQVAIAD